MPGYFKTKHSIKVMVGPKANIVQAIKCLEQTYTAFNLYMY